MKSKKSVEEILDTIISEVRSVLLESGVNTSDTEKFVDLLDVERAILVFKGWKTRRYSQKYGQIPTSKLEWLFEYFEYNDVDMDFVVEVGIQACF